MAQLMCLDRFIVMGTGHLDHLMGEYIRHYNKERPHSAIEFRPPAGPPTLLRMANGRDAVRCRTRLGGVVRHNYRAAALRAHSAVTCRIGTPAASPSADPIPRGSGRPFGKTRR